jgi:hypothetical protein
MSHGVLEYLRDLNLSLNKKEFTAVLVISEIVILGNASKIHQVSICDEALGAFIAV